MLWFFIFWTTLVLSVQQSSEPDAGYKKRPLVLAYAEGLSEKHILQYVVSARTRLPKALQIVLVDSQSRALYKRLHVRTVAPIIPSDRLPLDTFDARMQGRWADPKRYTRTTRYWNFCEYLKKEGDNYDWVLVTDTQDVFFRGNPFPLGQEYFTRYEGLLLSQVNTPIMPGSTDYRVIEAHYGEDVAMALNGTIPYTTGFAMGPPAMVAKMACAIQNRTADLTHAREACKDEQATLNVLVSENAVGPIIAMPWNSGVYLSFQDVAQFAKIDYKNCDVVLRTARKMTKTSVVLLRDREKAKKMQNCWYQVDHHKKMIKSGPPPALTALDLEWLNPQHQKQARYVGLGTQA